VHFLDADGLSGKDLAEARFRLGMFDPPELVPWSRLTVADNDTAEHRQLALKAAHKSHRTVEE
jgi:beta-glucosidase